MPIQPGHEARQPAPGARHLRERHLRGHQRREGGGIGARHATIGARPAPAGWRGDRQGPGLQSLGPSPRLLIVHLPGLELPPQRAQHGHTGDLLERARDIRGAQIGPVQPLLDTRQQLRRASSGRLQQGGQDRVHDGRIDLALPQHKGAKVLATLPKIFEMLARRLPVGTTYERG